MPINHAMGTMLAKGAYYLGEFSQGNDCILFNVEEY